MKEELSLDCDSKNQGRHSESREDETLGYGIKRLRGHGEGTRKGDGGTGATLK